MKTVSFALLILIGCATLSAQGQDVSISVKTDDHPAINVSNNHNLPVEAFLITVDTATTSKPLTRIYYDVFSNYKNDHAIPPGASQQVPLPHIVGQDLPIPTLRAVVFSDGTSLGDDNWIRELLHRRKILADRIEEVMTLLQDISNRQVVREDALDILQKAKKARLDANPSATPEERVWHGQIFYMAIRNLQGNPRFNGKVPDFPVTLKHLQKALANWLADLKSAKPGPPKLSPTATTGGFSDNWRVAQPSTGEALCPAPPTNLAS